MHPIDFGSQFSLVTEAGIGPETATVQFYLSADHSDHFQFR